MRLRYSSDAEPGFRRVRRGRGLRFVDPDGRPAPDEVVERAGALAIPPAWTDVWVCADPAGHLQATGRDARGRKQYRYHPRWRAQRESAKYDHLADVAAALPSVRTRVAELLSGSRPVDLDLVVAATVRAMDMALLRVGNDCYARDNGTYGATTLESRHVDVDGWTVRFSFRGKGNRSHEVEVRDPRLARAVKRLQDAPGQQLFTFACADGEWRPLRSDDVNRWLQDVSGLPLTAKDFRTWGGTAVAADALLSGATDVEAVDAAAERLGNTRAVCRRSYVHPEVLDAAADGRLEDAWARSRSTEWMDRVERAVAKVLVDASGAAAAA